jgi:IS30 family transposase
MITDRPFAPEGRSTAGEWEGDLIMGRHNRSAIATLVERQTRFVILLPVDPVDKAASVQTALTAAMLKLPVGLRRSLTWDQGSERARHAEITAATGMAIYFCEARSPWQRGSNENANALLRDYFPKGSNLTLHTPKHLAAVAVELNARPRKHSIGTRRPTVSLSSSRPRSAPKCCDHRWNSPCPGGSELR